MRIGKSRLNLTAGIRLSKNIFFGDGISGALAGRGIFGTTSQALAISPQFAQGAATFGTTSAAQLPYLAQGSNTFGADHSATASSATFLLDDYPNAAAAYSVRLLKSDYTGALVRIRKDTGGQPEKDFYPDSNNELSLNSSDGGTTLGSWIGSNDGYIVTWYDQSGNSNNATQTTAANQPQIINAGSLITDNGKASISFTGSESFNVSTISLTGDFAHFSVFNGTGFNYGSNYYLRYTGYLRYNGGTGVITSVNRDNLQTQCTWLRISNSVSNFYNGNTGNTGTDSSTFRSDFIGSYNGSLFWTGKQQEFVIYSTDQSSNRTGIETNINDYFNIYV